MLIMKMFLMDQKYIQKFKNAWKFNGMKKSKIRNNFNKIKKINKMKMIIK